MKVYGIKNCDTVKKALKQLDAQGSQYDFIDLKNIKLSADLLQDWLLQQPQMLVNKRSTTYRTVKADWLAAENDMRKQIQLIQDNPTLIKRPVVEMADKTIIVGYDTSRYATL